MTLIDYVMKYKADIQDIITMYYEQGIENEKDVRNYILEAYCPMYYINNIEPIRLNKQKECFYRYKENNKSKCKECWNRDMIIKFNEEEINEYNLYLILHEKYKNL